jgi:two-component system phosphate regulon sensor histidine kinase PhoR
VRARISLAFLGSALAVLAVAAWTGERWLRHTLREGMEAEIAAAARSVALALPPPGDPDAWADRWGAIFRARVTLVGPDGRVRGDSEFSGAALATLGARDDRPEVRAARETGSGRAVRYSESLAQTMVYVAVAGPDGWVARVGRPVAEVDAAVAAFRARLWPAALFALVFSVGLALWLAERAERPLRRAAEAIRALAQGAGANRLPEAATGPAGELFRALNRLGEQWRERVRAWEGARAESETLLDEMGEGVLALGRDGTVVRANAALARALGRAGPLEGRPLSDLFRDPALVRLLQPDRVPPEGAEGEFELDGRTWFVSARRLPAGGVVAVFADLTELRRLETVRSDFVANASHELKTPLTAIRGYAETLVDSDLPEPERRAFAERIVEHSRRMTRIVDDLLTLARLESPARVVRQERVPLRPLVDACWSPVAESAEASGVRFSVDCDPADVAVWGDPEGVRQILENLLDNALRHSGAQEIGVIARPEPDGSVRITVWDTGRGIASAHLGRIFERFYRVDPSRSRATGGTGLGLSIVKHWAETMGGRAWAESAVGHGTRVHVTLPGRPADASVGP